jgi:hypothetical protein
MVNVNVNSGGGGGGQKPVPFQIPSYIFDPSLITPRYAIMIDNQQIHSQMQHDLMTSFIQSLIANQAQKVD